MKTLIAIFMLISTSAFAQTSNFYGSEGDYLGTMQSAGQNNFIYGRDGDYIGSTAPAGRNTFVYDGNGNFVGTIMNNNQGRR
jgi:YD repeat-containing protein